jgi:hypothetical protein
VSIDRVNRKVELYRYVDLWDRLSKCSLVSLRVLLYVLMNRCDKDGIFTIHKADRVEWESGLGMHYRSIQGSIRKLVKGDVIIKLGQGVYGVDDKDFAIKLSVWERNPA